VQVPPLPELRIMARRSRHNGQRDKHGGFISRWGAARWGGGGAVARVHCTRPDADERVFVDNPQDTPCGLSILSLDCGREWRIGGVAIALCRPNSRIDQKIVKAAAYEPATPAGDAALVRMAHDGLK